MDLWTREARIFKFGSGAGSNFSSIRAENELLSGGGKSSGVMSFLKIGDRAAGAIKSGGTTRRAAKMVILDVDHPDIETFVDWKKVEEDKARLLIQHGGFPADFNGEAYATVSGQNSNNSVRVTNDFIQAVMDDGDWAADQAHHGSVRDHQGPRPVVEDRRGRLGVRRSRPAVRHHHQRVAHLPGGRSDQGVQPLLGVHVPRRHRLQPGVAQPREVRDADGAFDIEAYQHAIRLWTIVLEISVAMAHFPSPEIAQGSYDYRTLGLGYANLGSLLMRQGIAYDSDEGRAIAGALTAILTGYSYATRAEMASVVGPSPVRREPRAHAAGDPQPPPGRLRRHPRRVRGDHHHGDGHRPDPVPARHAAGRP
jgi:ribonucleoside-diphosphate reductase alpha chain